MRRKNQGTKITREDTSLFPASEFAPSPVILLDNLGKPSTCHAERRKAFGLSEERVFVLVDEGVGVGVEPVATTAKK
jgi:hypothetical protein